MAVTYLVWSTGTTKTIPSDYSTFVSAEALGGGQGGTAVNSPGTYGPGGKGAKYASITSAPHIKAGDVLSISIGGGGSGAASSGGDTSLKDNTGAVILLAPGGNSATTAVGSLINSGGTPGGGASPNGGGGSSAGSSAGTGNNGSNPTGATSPGYLADGNTQIGAGGNGGVTSANGNPGQGYGAGGGGAAEAISSRVGGAGYQGVIVFAYNPAATPAAGRNFGTIIA